MSARRAFTASSDSSHEIPEHPGARFDRIHAAIATLREEEQRLNRVGLSAAARRCRQQLRYWEFIGSLFAVAESSRPRRLGADR
jgi:hypothetical protein